MDVFGDKLMEKIFVNLKSVDYKIVYISEKILFQLLFTKNTLQLISNQ